MSTIHDVNVVQLTNITKHPDADTLSIVEVDGCPCIIRTADWNEGDLAIYVPVDSLVPTSDSRFSFLMDKAKQGRYRVRAQRLRGIFSMGLLVRPDEDMTEGMEVRERLDIQVYEPPEPANHGASIAVGRSVKDPGLMPVYDIESLRKYHYVFEENEEVVLTEKIHGANARFVHDGEQLWIASRTMYKAPVDEEGRGSMWSQIAKSYDLEAKLREYANIAIYGEVYGQVQDLKYDCGDTAFIMFDAINIKTRRWLGYDEFLFLARALDLPVAPELYRGPWLPNKGLFSYAEGPSILGKGKHVREGFVIRPVIERVHNKLGRVLLKLHGEGYLTRKEK